MLFSVSPSSYATDPRFKTEKMRMYTRFFETDKFVSYNVQEYLTTATLPELRVSRLAPPMPLPSCKSHRNTLNVRVERYRRLQQAHRLKRSRLDKQVNEC